MTAREQIRRAHQSFTDRVLKINEVEQKTNYSRASIYRSMSLGKFPQSIKLGERATGWLESDIDQWLQHKREEAGL